MKEIIRIHIAKVAYDIELDAKKELEKYLKNLEKYAGEPEVYEDMEIRVTELLSEAGVNGGDVISLRDVRQVRQILGEPEELEGEADPPREKEAESAPKRLYRDMDNAVLGGVLSGIAVYLKMDVVIVRVFFLVLAVASFGAMLVAYILLWILVPVAETTTQKMQSKGVEATLESIREFSSNPENQQKIVQISRNIVTQSLRLIGVIASVAVSIGALALVVYVVSSVTFSPDIKTVFAVNGHEWLGWTSLGLMATGGVLLSILGILVGVAIGRLKLGRRLIVAIATVVIGGILTFGAGVAGVAWQYYSL